MIGFMNMNECPMISVIVPVYNCQKYIGECIQSVQQQDYQNIELLLIDDGSTDRSGEICDRYSSDDCRIKVVHKENGGVSSARNLGLELCKGEYVMFLDSDDSITSNCVSVLIGYALQYSADIVAGQTVDSSVPWKEIFDISQWEGTEGLIQSLHDNPFTYSAWGKLYRTSFVGEVRFNEQYKINEDSLFVFELLCKQPSFIAVKEKIYCYRNNPDSASREAFSPKYFDIISVSKRKLDTIEKQYPEFIGVAENMQLKATMNILQILALRTHGEYKETERKLLKEFYKKSKCYISAKTADDKWFWILNSHLYWCYKMIMRIRKKGA